MRMNAEEALTLHCTRLAFHAVLDVDGVLPVMVTREVFSPEDVAVVEEATTRKSRIRQFVHTLESKPPPAFETFLEVLSSTPPLSQHQVLAGILRSTRTEITQSPTKEAKVKEDVLIQLVPVSRGLHATESKGSEANLAKVSQAIRNSLQDVENTIIHRRLLLEYGLVLKRIDSPQLEMVCQLQVNAKHARITTDIRNTALAQKLWASLTQLDPLRQYNDKWVLTTHILPSEVGRLEALAQGGENSGAEATGIGGDLQGALQGLSVGPESHGLGAERSQIPERPGLPLDGAMSTQKSRDQVVWNILVKEIRATPKKHYRDFYNVVKKCAMRADLTKLRSDNGYTLFHMTIHHRRADLMRVFQFCGLFTAFYQLPVSMEGGIGDKLTPTELAGQLNAANERTEMERLLKVEKIIERDPMKQACRAGRVKDFEVMVNQGQRRVLTVAESMSCLDWAIVSGSCPMVEAVIKVEKKIGVKRTSSDQIALAVTLGLHQIVPVLLSYIETDLDSAEIEDKKLLEKIAEFGDWEMFRIIRSAVSKVPETIVAIAAANGRLEFIERCLQEDEFQSHLVHTDKRLKVPLHFAVERGHTAIVKLLLSKGVGIEVKDKRGRGALHYAAEGGSLPTLEALILAARNAGVLQELLRSADRHLGSELCFLVRGRDQEMSAWHYVQVDRGLLDVFRVKTRGGAVDVARYGRVMKSGWGTNPSEDIVQEVEAQFDAANIKPDAARDMLPLHIAILKSNDEVALRLIELMDVDAINTPDCFDLTPLHLACMRGSSQVVAKLDAKGARRDCRDNKNRRPVDLAKRNDHVALVDLLTSGSLLEIIEAFSKRHVAPVLERLSVAELQRRSASGEDIKQYVRATLRDLTGDINSFLFDKLDSGPVMQESQR